MSGFADLDNYDKVKDYTPIEPGIYKARMVGCVNAEDAAKGESYAEAEFLLEDIGRTIRHRFYLRHNSEKLVNFSKRLARTFRDACGKARIDHLDELQGIVIVIRIELNTNPKNGKTYSQCENFYPAKEYDMLKAKFVPRPPDAPKAVTPPKSAPPKSGARPSWMQ